MSVYKHHRTREVELWVYTKLHMCNVSCDYSEIKVINLNIQFNTFTRTKNRIDYQTVIDFCTSSSEMSVLIGKNVCCVMQ